jgi:hypothetical protein
MAKAKKVSSNSKNGSKGKGNKGGTAAKVALISAGVIAAGAAAYYLSDKKRRAQAKGWMVKMKDETVKKLGGMGAMSKDMYHAAIDKIADKYQKVRDASPAEIAAMAAEMKRHWSNISKAKRGAKKSVKKAAGKVAKKATKKTAKKSA